MDVNDIKEDVKPVFISKMKAFRKEGYVHGDIRINNLGYATRNNFKQLVLIDFDWSGKENEDRIRYPWNIKLEHFKSVDNSIVPFGLITKEQDKNMLSKLGLKLDEDDNNEDIIEPRSPKRPKTASYKKIIVFC